MKDDHSQLTEYAYDASSKISSSFARIDKYTNLALPLHLVQDHRGHKSRKRVGSHYLKLHDGMHAIYLNHFAV